MNLCQHERLTDTTGSASHFESRIWRVNYHPVIWFRWKHTCCSRFCCALLLLSDRFGCGRMIYCYLWVCRCRFLTYCSSVDSHRFLNNVYRFFSALENNFQRKEKWWNLWFRMTDGRCEFLRRRNSHYSSLDVRNTLVWMLASSTFSFLFKFVCQFNETFSILLYFFFSQLSYVVRRHKIKRKRLQSKI